MALTTTTWAAIRDNVVTRIEAIAPTHQAQFGFRRSKKSRSVREWSKTTAVFRGFDVRRANADEPALSDPAAILRSEAMVVTVAYPVVLGAYGINDIDDMETLVRTDARLIRDAVYSAGGYVAGQQAALPAAIPTVDTGDGDVWFQELQFTVVYYEAQSLT